MDDRAGRLRRLAAELRAECDSIERTVTELATLDCTAGSRVVLYASAALLDTFYSGVEKAARRVASELGGVPEGSAWHRTLLDDMALDLPKLRPPVLRAATVRSLTQYLAFRHRFRNLYLFDLEPEPVFALVAGAASTWRDARADLESFADTLVRLADGLS